MPSSPVFMLPPENVRGHHLRDPAFRKFLVFSVAVHILVVIMAGTMTLFKLPGTAYSPTYTVDLVSAPSPQAPVKPRQKAAVKRVKPAPAPLKAPVPAKAGPDQASDFKITRKTVGEEDHASAQMKKHNRALEEKVERLLKNYSSDGPQDFSPSTDTRTDQALPAGAEGVSPVSGPSVAGKGTRPADIRFRAYYDQIWARIKAAWVPQGVSKADDDLLTVMGIRISPMGVIEKNWIERKSGNDYFDQSAIRVLKKFNKDNPLPPLPDELGEESLEVGVNFRITE